MWNRRVFLARLGEMPLVGGLLPVFGGATAPARVRRRDFFEELGVRPFINAAGTYTRLSASLMPPAVMEAMARASRQYVDIVALQTAVGARIAKLLGVEAAMVTSGAAGALTVGTAACITGTDQEKIRRIPDLAGMKSEVLVQKSHRYGYDHAVRGCGVRMIEVETADELERAASDRTAMMLFFNDADPRGKIHAEEWARLGRKLGIPTFNDAAADVPPVENLSRYIGMGFDLVAFSGGKGIMGPQSAGLLLGRRDLIEAACLNTSPHSDSVARGMKVNKEEMIGMLVALELYLQRDHAADLREWERRAAVIAEAAKQVKSVQSEVFVPPIANHVPHLRLRWDPGVVRVSPPEAKKQLLEGDPSIEACPLTSEEARVIGVWMMQPGDAETVARRLQRILKAAV
jgi:D-glucosaminate-6-phosphate ammonia-lyase